MSAKQKSGTETAGPVLCAVVRFIPPGGYSPEFFHLEITLGQYRPDDFELPWEPWQRDGWDHLRYRVQGEKTQLGHCPGGGEDPGCGFYTFGSFDGCSDYARSTMYASNMIAAGKRLKRWEERYARLNDQFGNPRGLSERLVRVVLASEARRVIFDARPDYESGKFVVLREDDFASGALLSRIRHGVREFEREQRKRYGFRTDPVAAGAEVTG